MKNELENSVNYITQKTGRKSGFSVPKNYFNGIEDDFLVKLSEEQLPKKTTFDIPKDYFSNLENEILAKVSIKEPKVISFRDRIFKFIPLAAAASIVLFIGFYFLNNQNNSITFDDISSTDVENWYDSMLGYSNNTELAFAYDVSDFDESELSVVTINDDVIEDYFNSIDNSTLLNEIQ
ncbi:hypothetical protein C7447_10927 [Tenacibaculum adriaticum]|uniref:Uncharacterized protein n=1 Tax=Tenacibaculum adriaticum TaxID=413713 RepID=A0A5S5DJG4_9FLAO|nr:hypothetical protein [Tenacibaculum adriaticum]TYP96090.1 hypothetical protein C7447_10927 [Tenacibaculum adriaticum]